MKYNVVLTVPDDVQASLDILVNRFRVDCSSVSAPGHRHLTLYRFYAPDADDIYVTRLRSLEFSPVSLVSGRFLRLFNDEHADGFSLVVPFISDQAICGLHALVADTLNSVREPHLCSHAVCSDPRRKQLCDLLGSPFYGPQYRPHVTLAVLNPGVIVPYVPVECAWVAGSFSLWKKSGCLENDGWESVQTFPLVS
ncbi:MAG TPA: hypothetical protein VJB87_01365 [Candidatus Nanoarchaeia archaeon]|nr:hypothetical protein [Candidatus Nanoarchaeia archaeon]